MLLDRIDIDSHGPLQRVELGPFGAQLNVIAGPEGSGKTAIVRFIRDSLAERQYPLGMMSSSTGRIVWADATGLVHCRREQDGTGHGRRTVEFEPRGDFAFDYDRLEGSWLAPAAQRAINQPGATTNEATRALLNLQLPESIVDGVITDTSITDVSRVVAAALAAGVDSTPVHPSVGPNDGVCGQAKLREELAAIESELASIGDLDRPRWIARREALLERLHQASSVTDPMASPLPTGNVDDKHRRLSELHARVHQLRSREAELRRSLVEIDENTRRHQARYTTVRTGPVYAFRGSIADQDLRRRIDDLDGQAVHLRRAATEIYSLRQWVTRQRDALLSSWQSIDQQRLQRMRYEGFVHAIDHGRRTDFFDHLYSGPYRPLMSIDEVEYRIAAVVEHLDWLLNRDSNQEQPYRWYRESFDPSRSRGFATDSINDSLRRVREELVGLRHDATGFLGSSDASVTRLDRLAGAESWLQETVARLDTHRRHLLHEHAHRSHIDTGSAHAAATREDLFAGDAYLWDRQRSVQSETLKQIVAELNATIDEAALVRASMRALPVVGYADARYDRWIDRDAIAAEIRDIDSRLASTSRIDWLRHRRDELITQLHVPAPISTSSQPLAESASRWWVRLSGGRSRQIAWSAEFPFHDSSARSVTLDGRPESDCPAADRALASIAVRMAAGELLAGQGRGVPLLLETPREIRAAIGGNHEHWMRHDQTDRRPVGDPIATALRDYTAAGRQIVLLTSDAGLTAQLDAFGARRFEIFSSPIVHPHRPLWQSGYADESYVGPHPHVRGNEATAGDYRTYQDINRDLDLAYRETLDPVINGRRRGPIAGGPATDVPPPGSAYRDGYYRAASYTTGNTSSSGIHETRSPSFAKTHSHGDVVPPGDFAAVSSRRRGGTARRTAIEATAANPFFLTVDSPIDQAPSIDAVAAARLRGCDITHINHLMREDSNRLSDALGLANVDAATIRRWQAECRLVCRVPQLRGFDARVLVGCGITSPAELASTHPADLLLDVEQFLATDRGQQLLLSGSSHELSRLTSWIAAAGGGRSSGTRREGGRRHRRNYGITRERRGGPDSLDLEAGFDQDRYEIDRDGRRRTVRSDGPTTRKRDDQTPRRRTESKRAIRGGEGRSGASNGYGSGRRSGSNSENGSVSKNGSGPGRDLGGGAGRGEAKSRDRRQRERRDRDRVVRYRDDSNDVEFNGRRESGPDLPAEERALKFYLHRDSPVVDAPSIGPRMASRLEAIGVVTVDDLLHNDAIAIADQLDHRRIDAETVAAWQQQATLVCRVPMLRGHDAQLLVAADVCSPEELADYHAGDLFALIDPIANGPDGKRILRGGSLPDLDEVSDWIGYASHHRSLAAA